jgi:hypothetical protein
MAIIGLSLEATKDYTSLLDPARNTPDATIWVLGTLDSRIMGKIRDKATTMGIDPMKPDEVTQTVNLREMDFETVIYGLKGVKNFNDAKGNAIKFNTRNRNHGGMNYEVADPAFVKLVPSDIISELAEQIRAMNSLTPAEAGNSDA